MTTYQRQHFEALEQCLNVALFHQSCLDADCSELIVKEHARHVASCRRKLNKALKESNV